MIAVGLAFIVLSGQLQLLMIVDVEGAGAHDVEAIGILQAGFGYCRSAPRCLCRHTSRRSAGRNGQAPRGVVVAAADRRRHVLVVIVMAAKAGFTADLQLDLLFLLPFW